MPETALHAPGAVSHSRSTVQCPAVFDFHLLAGARWPGAAFAHLPYTWEAQNSHVPRWLRQCIHISSPWRMCTKPSLWDRDWRGIDLPPARVSPVGLESSVLPRGQSGFTAAVLGQALGAPCCSKAWLGLSWLLQYCRLSTEVGLMLETARKLRKC